jgi:hypothetical protein
MSRSRRKLDTSPIEYEEVMDSPALKGMVSFLEVPPGQLPRLDFTGLATGAAIAPEGGTPFSGLPVRGEPLHDDQSGIPELSRPVTGIPLSGSPEEGTPQAGVACLTELEGGTPLSGIPFSVFPAPQPVTTPAISISVESAALSGGSEEGVPLMGPPFPGAPLAIASSSPSFTPPAFPAFPPVAARPLVRIRRATLAQDGHSLGEQALYEALWQHAHAYAADARIITLGYRRMAELARLTVNNSKANIQALIEKLAVEEAASFTHSQGRTYLVYSYGAIIERRRSAGLTHYVKTRGVVFVDPETGEPLTARVRDRSGIPFSGQPPSTAVPEGGARGAPVSDVAGTPDSAGAPYSQTPRQMFSNSTSTTAQGAIPGQAATGPAPVGGTYTRPGSRLPAELVQGLRQIVAVLDDEAAAVLWHQCRKRAPDCTPEEVLQFARAKAAVFRGGRIQNPLGFLLAAVPKCFEGAAFQEFRQEQARQRQAAEEQMSQMRREFEAILADPNSTEQDRAFVRRLMEGN